ncbi:MAG: carbohydrate kinase family protein [Pyrinomonadaceae bacterium]
MNFPFNLKEAAEFDVTGFGTNAVDHLIRVAEFPAHNSKVSLTGYTQLAGGEIASTMVGLARLGMRTTYAGRVGSDAAGELGRASLIAEGVGVEYCEIIEGAATQVAFIIVDERSGERTIIWDRDRRLRYLAADAPIDLAARTKILHMTPHDVEACISMAVAAHANGAVVSADIDNAFEGIEALLSHVDICIVSADFPEQLLGIADHRTALAEISARYGCTVAGTTLGADGSVFWCGGQLLYTPGFAVPDGCVDTTGAGDAFRTGFLYGILTGQDLEQSAVLANAVAALKCRASGARTGLPTQKELNSLIKKTCI